MQLVQDLVIGERLWCEREGKAAEWRQQAEPAASQEEGGTADMCKPPQGVRNTDPDPNVGADGDEDAATNLMMSGGEGGA